jgi:TonB family protein
MISRRFRLALGLAALASPATGAEQPTAAPPPIIYAPPAPPAPPFRPPPPPRPLNSGLRVIGGPDWGDPAIYPAAALRRDQEGAVRFELAVGTDGRPRTCTIVESSGFAELDDGTCRLALTMRFSPPREETRTRLRIVWLLAPDPMPFEPQRMVATLDFVGGGAVTGCTLEGHGPLFDNWARVACRTFELEADYYFGARRWGASRATVVVDMVPGGMAVPPVPTGRGPIIAVRRTAFSVDADGDPGACRTLLDRGFGRPRIDHADSCGFFLARGYEFVRAAEDADPRSGIVEVRVMLEAAKAPPSRR